MQRESSKGLISASIVGFAALPASLVMCLLGRLVPFSFSLILESSQLCLFGSVCELIAVTECGIHRGFTEPVCALEAVAQLALLASHRH